ncbi:MAG: 4Fe-4S dicluster domain-containing protein [Thermodesulfobacteriota bacterium]
MKIKLKNKNIGSDFVGHIEKVTGETAMRCYQCGNCTGGCPVSYKMEYGPSQIIRLMQIGQDETIKAANSMWLCVSCMQCFSRCPQGVSAAKIFEGLRQQSLRKGEDHQEIEEIPMPLLKGAPQQALVAGFRKLVS